MTNIELTAKKIAILKTFELFPGLDNAAYKELAGLASKSDFSKGEMIFREGDEPEYVYIVYKGKIKFFNSSASGKIITARVSNGHDLTGLGSFFSGQKRWLSALAVDDVKALKIRRNDFTLYINKHPEIMMNIIGIMERYLHGIYNRFKASVSYTVEQRTFDCIYNLYEHFGGTLPFSEEEIGGLVGTTRETVVRALSQLKKEGIISSSREKITIVDPDRLQKLMKESPII
jgi:CRP-like cAMP-binding protein